MGHVMIASFSASTSRNFVLAWGASARRDRYTFDTVLGLDWHGTLVFCGLIIHLKLHVLEDIWEIGSRARHRRLHLRLSRPFRALTQVRSVSRLVACRMGRIHKREVGSVRLDKPAITGCVLVVEELFVGREHLPPNLFLFGSR